MENFAELRDDFEAFFLKYRPLVFHNALRIVGEAQDAEDIVQDVFLTLWSRPNVFHGGNIESWLTTVAKNAALDRIRSVKREGRCFEALQTQELFSGQEERIIERMMCSEIYHAVDRMSCDRREVLRAVLFDGLSHASFATVRNVPLGTVKTRARAGLAELRRLFR